MVRSFTNPSFSDSVLVFLTWNMVWNIPVTIDGTAFAHIERKVSHNAMPWVRRELYGHERRDDVSQNLALHHHRSRGTRADNGIRPRAGAAAEDAVRRADVCGGEYYSIPILRDRRW